MVLKYVRAGDRITEGQKEESFLLQSSSGSVTPIYIKVMREGLGKKDEKRGRTVRN